MSARDLRLVVNTSPLIHLAEADLLHLLRDAAFDIWVPEPVATEIRAYGDEDPTARALVGNEWLQAKTAPSVTAEVSAWDLGPGESAVIELARAFQGSTAVIDDLAGRRCAEAFGLSLRGTVGLVPAGKQSGLLATARPVLERLRDCGMYLSDAVLERALRRTGE